MSTPTSDFTGGTFDFAMGEVYGIRVWRQDERGRLRARQIDGAPPWRPGLNTARCFASGTSSMAAFITTIYGPSAPQVQSFLAATEDAVVPDEKCKCGFYAYTSETLESFEAGGVLGVIRGSGRTLIGTKGFRCEKAEIVAVLDPTKDGRQGWADLARWQREALRRVYPDIPVLDTRQALLDFAPIEWTDPRPSDDDFWTAP